MINHSNILYKSDYVTVTFPDAEVVTFERVGSYDWELRYARKVKLTEEQVAEYIDAYLQQDELSINFLNERKVVLHVPPYKKGGVQV